VALSLAAILPIVYAVKHVAADGADLVAVVTLVTGAVSSVVLVQRQRRLTNPLLDMTLFASRTFSAALSILLVGLVGVGGVMFLVTQYLQLVAGLSPLAAGAWFRPAPRRGPARVSENPAVWG
jgi:DHA2 family multidrug resistance protein-like MFS transporter